MVWLFFYPTLCIDLVIVYAVKESTPKLFQVNLHWGAEHVSSNLGSLISLIIKFMVV